MKCSFIDYRPDFRTILADKLGESFDLASGQLDDDLSDCGVIMVGIPPRNDPAFTEQIAALTTAAITVWTRLSSMVT